MSSEPVHSRSRAERVTLFADILLPVPVAQHYTYRVPYRWNPWVREGVRVIVQFGAKKILTGIVLSVHETPPSGHEAKYILDILDEEPVINALQVRLFRWLAAYYMCAEGQVLQVALPSGLKLSSQSRIQLHPEFDPQHPEMPMSDEESILLAALQQEQALNYSQAGDLLASKNVHKVIKSLLSKSAVLLFEEVKERYQPKKEKRLRLAPSYCQPQALEELLDQLKKKTKQTDVLLKYLQMVPVLKESTTNKNGVSKAALLSQGLSPSSVSTLLKNGILEEFEEVVSRFDHPEPTGEEVVLTPAQAQSRDDILRAFQDRETVLIHGITGSGKTEIYIDLIKEVLQSGSQVLYLLPEIALTTQIVRRLQKIFGNALGVYHSKFSDNERVEVWRNVLEEKFSFIVGVRSSVFLPFNNLGLIIVDEEHELSYKQFDPAPRYHARDVALMLARFHHAKTLLGSATPSMESFFHAQNGKYGLVVLGERYGDALLPTYELIDIRKEHQKKTMRGSFSPQLMLAIKEALDENKQAIVFQNRRGYAPYLQCRTCGYIPPCPNCSVTLTYHLHYNQLQCHYCGYKERMPSFCSTCGSSEQDLVGFGTEKLEEELKEAFPEARIQRMDLDTTRRKYSYQQIIDRFEKGAIDILIGTQMVSKGLDFDRVDLVGVLDIDRSMHFPDFRSHERTFQIITQVGGRAGRRSGKGKVLIQTKSADHRLLQLISAHDYPQFYRHEIAERAKYRYPPFARLLRLTIKSPERELGHRAAQELTANLIQGLGKKRVLGPQEPVISKLRKLYLMELYVKIEKGAGAMESVKSHVAQTILKMTGHAPYRSLRIVPDVDPY